jgi:chromate transport protein ChrA
MNAIFMEKTLARILSVILHPLLVPTYFLLVLYRLPIIEQFHLPFKIRGTVLLFVFLMTFVLPVMVAIGMRMLKLIESMEMQRRRERILPMVVISIFFYITFYSLKQLAVFQPFTVFMLGATVLVLLGLILNYFYKISQHMLAWGGFTGALTALALSFHIPLYFWLFGVILASGLTGFARLKTEAHTPFEVYSGWLLGALVMSALFLLL